MKKGEDHGTDEDEHKDKEQHADDHASEEKVIISQLMCHF